MLRNAVLPQDWFASHVATYLERDMRQVLKVQNLPVSSAMHPQRRALFENLVNRAQNLFARFEAEGC